MPRGLFFPCFFSFEQVELTLSWLDDQRERDARLEGQWFLVVATLRRCRNIQQQQEALHRREMFMPNPGMRMQIFD